MKLARIFSSLKRLGLALALGAGLVGCAVLTVDVDVYKGALVNEEHVQLHQLVALATAAKPMLVQLRDSLEWPSSDMPVATSEDKKEWYSPEYIEPPKRKPDPSKPSVYLVPPQMGWWCKRNDWLCSAEVLQHPYFKNVMAVRVNEVLGLYDTLDEQGRKIKPTNRKAGLTHRIDHYLELSRASDHSIPEDLDGSRKSLLDAEHELVDALVEFASKVLFLANHEGLLSPPETPGLILGGAEKFTRGILGDFVTDHSMYALLNTELAQNRKHQYVRVLQAVGNSILFSANELRERDRYREQGQRKVTAEVVAANSVYSPNPKKVLDDLLKELEREKFVIQTQLDDAKAIKSKAEKKISSLEPKKTELHKERDKAEEALDNYRNEFSAIEATQGVLMTQVSEKDKTAWKAEWQTDVSKLEEFLSGTDSLKHKLVAVRDDQGTSPTQELFNKAISYIESQRAVERFEAYRVIKSYTSKKRSDLLDEFIAHIQSQDTKRRGQTAQYEKERDKKAEALRAIEAEIQSLTEEVGQLDKRISEFPNKKDLFEAARTSIESIRADILKEAGQSSQFVLPSSMYRLIETHLKKAEETAQGDKKQPYQKAQVLLSTRTPPPGMPPLDPGNYKNPIEVMDAVIALLRHHQMEVVQHLGQDSDESKRAIEAVENAYRHRAGMMYIRPSSAYLRTSFPSTSLQDDPNLAWDNMLLKQGLRNLPFSSELRDILDPSVKQDRTLTSELDKQYWQNINRVRVSGAGGTNQALVKDDVGNWYVKQYFGDTKRIWESAKNLALFSMSAKVPIDLAKQLNKASSPEELAENNKESPTLQKVLEKHTGVYATHTKEIQAKLESLHDKELEETLIAAWDAHTNLKEDTAFNAELKQGLTAEIVTWKAVAKTLKEKVDQDPGQAIVKDVGALSRLGRMLSASIAKISSSDIAQEEKALEKKQKKLAEEILEKKDAPDAEKKKLDEKKTELDAETKKLELKKTELEKKREMAVFEVNKIVGGQVTGILTDRNRVLDQYEQAIVFIGDAANPKETKQSN